MIFGCDFSGNNLLDSYGDNPLSYDGNDPLNSAGDILYSVEEHSYTPLGNIKTIGDIKPFRC